MKPLDFIVTKEGNVGIITEVSTAQDIHAASIEFLNPFQPGMKTAWWEANEFKIIDNLPDVLSRCLVHPFGGGSFQPFQQRSKR